MTPTTPPQRGERAPLSERLEALLVDLADGERLSEGERAELEVALGGPEALALAESQARGAATLARRLSSPPPPATLAPQVLLRARRRRPQLSPPPPRPHLDLWVTVAAVVTLLVCWLLLVTQRRAYEARLSGELRPVEGALPSPP
jgi:hypothetical protein